MREYVKLVELAMAGEPREDRTGVGTYGVFGAQFRHNMDHGFPLLTLKRVHWKSVMHELFWFLAGDTNVRYLKENGVSIWDEWANEEGELGPVYGKQWRDFAGVDQIQNLLRTLEKDPNSRRMVVSAWNPAEIPQMALPPCHTLFQVYVGANRRLSLHMYQRSADVFLGVPFNIASYALLLKMLAHAYGFTAGDLIISFGDLHLYKNHLAQAELLLDRAYALPPALPNVKINSKPEDGFWAIKPEDVVLEDYTPLSSIPAPVAV